MVKETYTLETNSTTLAVVDGKVKSVRFVSSNKTGYRVYQDGKIGVAGQVGKPDATAGFADAEKALAAAIPYPGEPEKELCRQLDLTPDLPEDAAFLAQMEALLSTLREKYPTFIFSNNIRKNQRAISLVNDAGLSLSQKDSYLLISLVLKEKSSANIMDLFLGYMGRHFDPDALLAEAESLCGHYYNEVDLEEGVYPVLFTDLDPAAKIVESLRGDLYATGASLFSGKLGETLFDRRVTFYQEGDGTKELGAVFFDAEGVCNKNDRFTFIENGMLRGLATSKQEKALYNLPLSGSAAAEYDKVPVLGGASLAMSHTGQTVKEVTGGGKAVYVFSAGGGDTTPQGDYATPVQIAYLVENGEIVGRLPQLSVSGNIFDLFGKDFLGYTTDTLCKCPSMPTDGMLALRMKVSK